MIELKLGTDRNRYHTQIFVNIIQIMNSTTLVLRSVSKLQKTKPNK